MMYYLMQPTRLSNPGVAALKLSRPTANYIELLRSEREAAKTEMKVEREFETTGAATREKSHIKPETESDSKPESKKVKVQTSTRSRSRLVPRPQAEAPHYAQQRSFGDYRPMY